jgi:hypothetical protein
MDDQEYLRVLSEVEVFRSKLNVPGFVSDKSPPRYDFCSKNARFGYDLSLCMEFLRKRGLIPVCDPSVKRLSEDIYPCSHPEFLGVYDRVTFTNMTVLEKLTQDDPSIVWISWGSSFGLADQKYLYKFRRIGQIYGIVGASALNSGYAGLRLFEIENIEGPNVLSRSKKIAFFYRGPQPTEATATLIDSLQNQDDPLDPEA